LNPRPDKQSLRFLHAYCFSIVGMKPAKHKRSNILSSGIYILLMSPLVTKAITSYDTSIRWPVWEITRK